MSKIAPTAVNNIIKARTNFRVSEDAGKVLATFLEDFIEDIAAKSKTNAQHAHRLTIRVDDIQLALKQGN